MPARPASSRTSALPPLLPEPRRAQRRPGRFALRDDTPVVLSEGADDRDFAAARTLARALGEPLGLRLPVETHARPLDAGSPHIALARDGEDGEGHRIEIGPGGVRVRAEGIAGLRHAVATLVQLADARGGLPACEIEDAPDLPRRGIMLDVSRGKVPSEATLRALVDLCAAMKLNVLMLYVEHPFRFRRHPGIGEGASPLEAETLRALDAYAAERGVELIPCLQSLGHMERILSLPQFAPLAETEIGWTISPAAPGTYDLLRDLYDEFLPNFRSPLFNANCDEPWDLERGRSAARAAELGPGGVYLEHVRRVRDLAAVHGKRTLIWGDVVHAHPERIPEIDRDLVMLDWWYEAELDYERVAAFARHGIDFWVCPGTSTWNSLFPRVANSLRNIERWADAGRRHGAAGLLVTDWGDFGHYNLQGNSWLAYAWAAQQAWSGAPDPKRFDRAFSRLVFGDASGEAAAVYHQLGAIHDPGFSIFNGSALQYLFFDDPGRGFFVAGARRGALRRCARALERVRARLDRARPRFVREPLTWEELSYAVDASQLAVRKAAACLDELAWRSGGARLDAAGRRALARRLRALAEDQAALGRRLRRLWLARSRPSDLARTLRRLRRSVGGLRRAATRLERNRPAPPPPPHPGFSPGSVIAELRRSLAS